MEFIDFKASEDVTDSEPPWYFLMRKIKMIKWEISLMIHTNKRKV